MLHHLDKSQNRWRYRNLVGCGTRTNISASIPPKVPRLPTPLVMRPWCVNAPYEGDEPPHAVMNTKAAG